MRNELLRWQWTHYADNHTSRANLLAHLVTVPLFMAGSIALLLAPFSGANVALGGLGLMVLSVAIQGRTHRLEAVAPMPFASAVDAVLRIVVEQWVTFPRYLASGRFTRALDVASREGSGAPRT